MQRPHHVLNQRSFDITLPKARRKDIFYNTLAGLSLQDNIELSIINPKLNL